MTLNWTIESFQIWSQSDKQKTCKNKLFYLRVMPEIDVQLIRSFKERELRLGAINRQDELGLFPGLHGAQPT